MDDERTTPTQVMTIGRNAILKFQPSGSMEIGENVNTKHGFAMSNRVLTVFAKSPKSATGDR